jgi:hypothetical protein
MKLPAIQFYPGDWLRDSVAGCSIAAQGLWLRMMFLMHDSERYGYLQQNGKPIPSDSIARRCGCTPEEYLSLLSELDDAGVFSRSSDGIVFSRRMVRDAAERSKNADRQRRFRRNHGPDSNDTDRGDGTPDRTPRNGSDNAPTIGRSNGNVTGASRASSASSSASSSKPITSNLSSDGTANGADAPATPPSEFTVLGYLQYLKSLPAFDHIDPAVEESRISLWRKKPKNARRHITQNFVEDWVKRIERPLNITPSAEATPPPPASSQLPAADADALISQAAAMLREGADISDLDKQFASTLPRSQWATIRSAAQAQARVKPKPAEPPPPQSGNVVPLARAQR